MADHPLVLNKTARALIIEDEKILMCREKGGKFFFLPGWNVGHTDRSEEVIRTNISQNLESKIKESKYIGAISSTWKIDKYKDHQHFDLVYLVELHNKVQPKKDDQVEFTWHSLETISENSLHPKVLKSKITEWFSEKKVFWAST